MFDSGFFGNLFDLDRDGNLSDFEKAVDFGAFVQLVESEETDEEEEDF